MASAKRGIASARRQDPALLRQAEEILATVRALWRDLLRNPYADAEQHGMTGPQITVMACLVSKGPMTLTELSRSLGMSHSSASGIVDRLEARGLVRRTQDATDRRRTSIEVTEAVQRYVRELEAGPSGRLVQALSNATPAQRAAIKKGLDLLCDLLGSRRNAARISP
jgi:MarR family transcriptional regulator, organic hydroperoxide resistance regulator